MTNDERDLRPRGALRLFTLLLAGLTCGGLSAGLAHAFRLDWKIAGAISGVAGLLLVESAFRRRERSAGN